jgi:transcriptional regulator with XRE-family HTH domain
MTVVSNSIDRFVGMRLRLQRERLRFSREQFAGSLRIAESELNDYETGAVRVSARLLQKIAEGLAVPPSYFFNGMEVVPAATVEEKASASPEAA